ALNLTGGSLTINYTPSWDSTIIGAEFSAPVTLGGTANLSVNTLQVDAAQAFTVAGGSLTFNAINLMPGATPARLVIGGDITLSSLLSGDSTIAVGSGTGSLAYVDLNGASHAWNVVSGSSISVQTVVKNGGLSKIGSGALSLEAPNQYAGGTVVSAGRLYVNNASGSGTGSGTVTVNGGTLGGTGAIAGSTVINSSGVLAPGAASIGSLAFSTPPTLNGTTFLRIDSDGGTASADQIIVSSGTLTFGGTLMVSNAGPALVGGEAFTNFIAPARSGAFESVSLPPLAAGLNWYLGDMTPFGRIKVNRSPSAGVLTFTNIPGGELQIPLASLLDGATDADGDALALDSINLVSTNGVALSTNASFLLYSNSLNPADRISFTLTDGHGGTATGYVYIAASARGQFGAQPVVSSAAATVQFFGSPQGVYYLERSTNLTDWITISTNTMPANGVRSYMDDFGDLAAVPAAAFYRLRW
ncbi:MAG TPA: autotransporter-associated beta strand repeat-containing protein, partial [Verrucomicrobiae bacterium]|nr:autotransporter-associated beta strand repeat-containing protein [Verrucomicrobiae bacterium]